MKLNDVFKIITFILPTVMMFSCSFQKNKIAPDKSNKSMNSYQDINTNDQLDTLKQNSVVYFDLNKFSINARFSKILNDTVDFLYSHPDINVIIEGHTDKRGSDKYNIELGKRRANAVKTYLESRGIPSGKISIISYGSGRPIENGDKEDSYVKNRRAVIVY
ncbi:MAG: OmpA family protein [Buchnera aphidicola (Nurudea shiraii)]